MYRKLREEKVDELDDGRVQEKYIEVESNDET